MALIATFTFDDEDPDVHAHFAQHAHALEADDPHEWVRVLAVFADAMRDYAARIDEVAGKIGSRLEHEAAARAQLGRDQAPTW